MSFLISVLFSVATEIIIRCATPNKPLQSNGSCLGLSWIFKVQVGASAWKERRLRGRTQGKTLPVLLSAFEDWGQAVWIFISSEFCFIWITMARRQEVTTEFN